MKIPLNRDVSKPAVDEYDYDQAFYRDAVVAENYPPRRIHALARKRRSARRLHATTKALDQTTNFPSVLDLPCATERFNGHLADQGIEVIGGAD